MHIAASVWGDPSSIIISFGSTMVGLEKCAEFFNNLPMFMDEREIANWTKESDYSRFVYTLTEGLGNAKGTHEGGLQTKFVWNLVILTNGEGPLLSERDKSGMKCRVLEISSNEMVCENIFDIE